MFSILLVWTFSDIEFCAHTTFQLTIIFLRKKISHFLIKFVANASVLLGDLLLIPGKIEKNTRKQKTERYFLKDKTILEDMCMSRNMLCHN